MNSVTSVQFHGVDADIVHSMVESGGKTCEGGRVSQFLVYTAGGMLPLTKMDVPPVDLILERGKVTIVTEDSLSIDREALPERGSRIESLPPEGTSIRFVLPRLLMRCAGCGTVHGLPNGYKYSPEKMALPQE